MIFNLYSISVSSVSAWMFSILSKCCYYHFSLFEESMLVITWLSEPIKMRQLLERSQFHVYNPASFHPVWLCLSFCLDQSRFFSQWFVIPYIDVFVFCSPSRVHTALYTDHILCDQHICFQSYPVLHTLS